MTITLKEVRKVAVVAWHQFSTDESAKHNSWTIVGAEASLSVTQHDGTEHEVRNVKNDGETNLFFPKDYSGSVKVTIRGSHSGEDFAILSVP